MEWKLARHSSCAVRRTVLVVSLLVLANLQQYNSFFVERKGHQGEREGVSMKFLFSFLKKAVLPD